MVINNLKSALYFLEIDEALRMQLSNLFDFSIHEMQAGIKYLGFMLKPNKYGMDDWKWLLSRVERRINLWCNRCISRGSRLTLIKLVIEAMLDYWHLLAQIPKGILSWIRKLYFNYLWKGSTEYLGSHRINWKCLLRPKDHGG